MIFVKDKELVFRTPAQTLHIATFEAIFAHTCPNCRLVVHGLFRHDPSRYVPKDYLKPGSQELNLRKFSQQVPGHVAPEYTSRLIRLEDGTTGQYFFDAFHMVNHGLRSHGRCRFNRGVDCFSQDVAVQVIRVLGHLRAMFGAADNVFSEVKAKLLVNQTIAEKVKERLMERCNAAPDAIGAFPPVILISPVEWGYPEFASFIGWIQQLPA